jgi:hypothetical protein
VVNGITEISNAALFTITSFPPTLIVTGLNITATVNVAQDFTVALFTDTSPNAQPGAYAVPVNFGDGTPVLTGSVTQPGGPGTPFLVEATHTYTQTGTFTVQVQVFKEIGGFGEAMSTATVNSGAAPRASGHGGASSLGRELLVAMNGMQASGRHLPQDTIARNPSAASAMLLPSAAPLQGGQPTSADLYWQLMYRWREHRITDPNDWAAHELTLALEGT